MAHEIASLLPVESSLIAPVKEEERPEIFSILDLSDLIGEQSADRLYPHTSDLPFAYLEIAENRDDWKTVQIVGTAPVEEDKNLIRFSNSHGGFFAYKDMDQRDDVGETPMIHITPSWFTDRHKIRAVEPQTVKGRKFFGWAATDRTLLDPDELRGEFNEIRAQNTGPYAFRELRALVSIAKALIFKENDEAAVEVLIHLADMNKTKLRKSDTYDLLMIKEHRPPSAPRPNRVWAR